MRTDSVLVPQSMSLIAWMTFLRACVLVVGRDRVLEVEEDHVGAPSFAAFSNSCG